MSHKNNKKMNKSLENCVKMCVQTVKHWKDGDDEEIVSGKSNVETSVNCNALLESLTLLSKELKDFKKDMTGFG